MRALILLVYCHVPVLHVSVLFCFTPVCRLSLCNCKHNKHMSQELRILLSPCICMFRNDDVIVQMPCKILDDSPRETIFFFFVEFRKFSCTQRSRRDELSLMAIHVHTLAFLVVCSFLRPHIKKASLSPSLFQQEATKTLQFILYPQHKMEAAAKVSWSCYFSALLCRKARDFVLFPGLAPCSLCCIPPID